MPNGNSGSSIFGARGVAGIQFAVNSVVLRKGDASSTLQLAPSGFASELLREEQSLQTPNTLYGKNLGSKVRNH
jgi:hypothetical protein